MLERDIEDTVCRWAKLTYGFIPYKFTSPNRRSVPDRMFVGDEGHLFFIEFKSASGQLTEAQGREIKRLVQRGFRVYVVRSVEHGKRVILHEIKEYAPWVSTESGGLRPEPRSDRSLDGHGSG